MRLRFCLLGGDVVEHLVDARKTVAGVKYLLSCNDKAPLPDVFVLMVGPRVLSDADRFFDTGVCEGDLVHVTKRFRACGLRRTMAAPSACYCRMNVCEVTPSAGETRVQPSTQIAVQLFPPALRLVRPERLFDVRATESGRRIPGQSRFDESAQRAEFVPDGELAPATHFTVTVFAVAFHTRDVREGVPYPWYTWTFKTRREEVDRDDCAIM